MSEKEISIDNILNHIVIKEFSMKGIELDVDLKSAEVKRGRDSVGNNYMLLLSERAIDEIEDLLNEPYDSKATYLIVKDSESMRKALSQNSFSLLFSETYVINKTIPVVPAHGPKEISIERIKDTSAFDFSPFGIDCSDLKKLKEQREFILQCFIAKMHDTIVAVLLLGFYGNCYSIEYVYTLPRFRNRKIASCLISTVLSAGINMGVQVAIGKLKLDLKALFVRLGFTESLTLRCYIYRKISLSKDRKLPGLVPLNNVLKSSNEFRHSIKSMAELNLPTHIDPPKNWDSFAALSIILNFFPKRREDIKILDAGGETYSCILPMLTSYGFQHLECINIAFTEKMERGNIIYRYGDITNTQFADNYFDAIVCLSVIEHGVDLALFFKEMNRVLKDGGILITSTDFWSEPIDTNEKLAFGVPIKIFNKAEIVDVLKTATDQGLYLMDELRLDCGEKVVKWQDLEYTFIYFSLHKVSQRLEV